MPKLFLLLPLLLSAAFLGGATPNRCNCGQFLLAEMEKFEILDDANGPLVNGWRMPIGKGGSGEVFHVHPHSIGREIIGGNLDAVSRCMALKTVDMGKIIGENGQNGKYFAEMMENEVNILRHFSSRSGGGNHVIKAYLIEKLERTNRLVFLMELGQMDLAKRMALLKGEWKRKWKKRGKTSKEALKEEIRQKIGTIFKEMALALKTIHPTTMHLDLTPLNMLYVEEGSEENHHHHPPPPLDFDDLLSLRLIDFGTAKFIPENENDDDEEEGRWRANVCVNLEQTWIWPLYSCPEIQQKSHNDQVYKVSTKADIFSLALILAELLMHTPQMESWIGRHLPKFFTKFQNAIGKLVWKKAMAGPVERIQRAIMASRGNWLKAKVQKEFPQYFILIKAMLQQNPIWRPTAIGILDYLEHKCRLKFEHQNPADVIETTGQPDFPECDTETSG